MTLAAECLSFLPELCAENAFQQLQVAETVEIRRDGLPPEVQTVVKLRFYEDMPLREIGEVTGWNLNTVKSRLYAGLRKLRASLEGVEIE